MFNLPKKLVDEIAKSPRGVIPDGIRAIKDAVTPKSYVSEKPENLGVTYTKVGPVSVMTKGATPESKKRAIESKNSKKPIPNTRRSIL